MKYTPVGVDIAKHVIQIHFIDELLTVSATFVWKQPVITVCR
ncbi:hypothetical protein [Candidatus Regiella insecticola]|nr:hypothetical protein [Candidatus Regiella insecticola]